MVLGGVELTEAAQNHAVCFVFYMLMLQSKGVVSSVRDDINSIPAVRRSDAVRLLGEVLRVAGSVDVALQCINYTIGDIDEQ